MTAALWHCKSDCELQYGVLCRWSTSSSPPATGRRCTTAAASSTSLDHPTGGPRQTKRQSPSEGREGNRSRAGLPPTATDASSKRPTINLLKKPLPLHRKCWRPLQCCHFDIVILRVAIISNVKNVRLQHRHRPTDDVSTRGWRGSQQTGPIAPHGDQTLAQLDDVLICPVLYIFSVSVLQKLLKSVKIWQSCSQVYTATLYESRQKCGL